MKGTGVFSLRKTISGPSRGIFPPGVPRQGQKVLPGFLGGLFLLCAGPLHGHIADEIAVKTTVELRGEDIGFSFDISSGVLFSTAFLKTLDPDKNKTFEDPHIRDFSDFFLKSVKIQFQGETKVPTLSNFTASEWDFFAAGISTIILDYTLPSGEDAASLRDLRYEFSFYPNAAVYSLNVKNRAPGELAVIEERRNEYLQDILELRYTGDPREVAEALALAEARAAASPGPPPPAPASERGRERASWGELLRNGFEIFGILRFLRESPGAPAVQGEASLPRSPASPFLALLLFLAVVVGFLHAFTPGHGKALVGAFLIANQGTPLHALFLGLVITVTHTVSIYAFGLLASTAAQFFLPGEFVPVLSLLCGIFITGLGVRTFVKRLLGSGADHAHLLPNLRLLEPDRVNILIDGAAAEANEALLIASDDEALQESLKAAGAEDFNLCSPGCSTHTMIPRALRERRNSEFFKLAIKTGAVDAVVTVSDKTVKHIGRLRERTWVQTCDSVTERPRELLFRAVGNYSRRGEIVLPEERLSWGRVVSLGITGGIIPCPDALAVLLAAIAAGKIALGMGIIFLFSLGLAFALILVGMIIVFTKRLLQGQRKLGLIVGYLPYVSSLFITGLGVLMMITMLKNFFRFS
jgi:ABC-type nickel/cobalt efflux system permease component RcnA